MVGARDWLNGQVGGFMDLAVGLGEPASGGST
jgi:hypothetical protein